MRICSVCHVEKEGSEYSPGKARCKTCNAADSRAWYFNNRSHSLGRARAWKARNAGRVKQYKVQWNAENPDLVRAMKRRTYLRNPEKDKARAKDWRTNNVERSRQHRRAKRARKRLAAGFNTFEAWMMRVAFYGWRCAYCRDVLTTETLTQDHRIPLSRGGSLWASNLLPACIHCNSSKRAIAERIFRKRIEGIPH